MLRPQLHVSLQRPLVKRNIDITNESKSIGAFWTSSYIGKAG
jgi:hypothetical protein